MTNVFSFNSQPNAGKLINSLRHLGYTNYSAIADLVDNSFDADASSVKIYIRQRENEPEIIIADDGLGMDDSILSQAIRLGSDVEKSDDSDLGKFGMGLCTASLSISRETTVLTKTEDGKLLKAINDVDEVIKQNSFVSFFGSPTMEDSILFDEMTGNSGHGTVVILRRCDNISNKNLSALSGKLSKELARIFRYFLYAGKRISLNDRALIAIDPLEWDSPDTNRFDESDIEIHIGDVSETIHVKIAVLADNNAVGEKEIASTMHAQGFYVMRNNREIMDGVSLGLFTKHNSLNRLRIELAITGQLDKLMGINFTKRNVNLEQSLQDKLGQYFKGQIATIRNRVQRETSTETPDDIQDIHSDVSQEIRKKSKLLMTPKAPKETRESVNQANKEKDESEATDKVRSPNPERQQAGGFTADCEFLSASMTPYGPIYSAEQVGRKIIITYNSDHAFYSRFILEPGKSDKRLVAGIDYLIYSLATAELQQNTDDESIMALLGRFQSIMSVNLRTLLS
ncbi:MAG: ATP-binding protein [Methylophilaceae bacterium]